MGVIRETGSVDISGSCLGHVDQNNGVSASIDNQLGCLAAVVVRDVQTGIIDTQDLCSVSNVVSNVNDGFHVHGSCQNNGIEISVTSLYANHKRSRSGMLMYGNADESGYSLSKRQQVSVVHESEGNMCLLIITLTNDSVFVGDSLPNAGNSSNLHFVNEVAPSYLNRKRTRDAMSLPATLDAGSSSSTTRCPLSAGRCNVNTTFLNNNPIPTIGSSGAYIRDFGLRQDGTAASSYLNRKCTRDVIPIAASPDASSSRPSTRRRLSTGHCNVNTVPSNNNPVPTVDSLGAYIHDRGLRQDRTGPLSETYKRHSEESPSSLSSLLYGGSCRYTYLPIYPEYIRLLLRDRHFMENIRAYNQMFNMTSLGARVDESVNIGRGPYVFKISDQLYQWLGSLCPIEGDPPRFLQLYIYDTENEVDNRMSHFRGNDSELCRDIVEGLIKLLDNHNALVQLFRTAREKLLDSKVPPFKVRLYSVAVHANMNYQQGIRQPQCVNKLHPSYMALQFPLLFVYGEDRYSKDMKMVRVPGISSNEDRRLTIKAYYSYVLHDRVNSFNYVSRTERLFQKYIVTAFCAVEQSRIDYIREHQNDIRNDYLSGIYDAITRGDSDGSNCGGKLILPQSFTGGPRYMYAHYLDALAICCVHGNPSYFITFTCNVKWHEIAEYMDDFPEVTTADREDIVDRVFEMKIHQFVKYLRDVKPFGKIIAIVYMVEFQKRGLPHCHTLIWVYENSRVQNHEDIDNYICAELPSKELDLEGHRVAAEFMIHGPCGPVYPTAVCMKNGPSCTKHFPKEYCQHTYIDSAGFVHYRRRDTGSTTTKQNIQLDNGYVIPYNKQLLKTFYTHINVKHYGWTMLIKYLFKYISKGTDKIVARVSRNDAPCWRLFEFDIHHREPAVQVLAVHGQNMQRIVFRERDQLQSVADNQHKKKTSDGFAEAASTAEPSELRTLLAYILTHCQVSNPLELWKHTWNLMSNDIPYVASISLEIPNLHIHSSKLENYTKYELEACINHCSRSLTDFGIPLPPEDFMSVLRNRLLMEEKSYNQELLAIERDKLLDKLNDFASSGIASLLLPSGRIAYSWFKLPLELTDSSVCSMTKNTQLATLLKETDLIIWDKSPMNDRRCFETLDKTLKDILDTSNKLFGSKTVMLGGDFRQTLLVKKSASRTEIISSSIAESYLWRSFKLFVLTENMRLTQGKFSDAEKEEVLTFANWLLNVGDGTVGIPDETDPENTSWIDIPVKFQIPDDENGLTNLIHFIYDNHTLLHPTGYCRCYQHKSNDHTSRAEIFEQLALMGYHTDSDKLTFQKGAFSPQWRFLIHNILHCLSPKKTAWEQFSSNIAAAIICLATNRKFNFSRMIFEHMVSNISSPHKFLMYPRFIQICLDMQRHHLQQHTRIYPVPSLSMKVFSNMKRSTKGFSGQEVALFPSMLAVTTPLISPSKITSSPSPTPLPEPTPAHTPSPTQPSPTQLSPTQPGTEHHPPTPHDSPLHAVHSHGSDEGSLKLQELMNLVTTLSDRIGVLEADLMKTKKTYSSAYTKLILRVKKLESQIKIGKARRQARVVLSEDEAFADDSSKQGRKFSDEGVQEKASTDTEIFIQEVTPTEVIQDQEGSEKASDAISTAGAKISTASEEVPIVSTAEVHLSTAGGTVTYSRRSAEKRSRQDKGKAIMIEEEPKKKSKKELEQERLSYAEAIRLEEQMNEEQRAQIARQWDEEERKRAMDEAKTAKKIDWNDPSVIRYHTQKMKPKTVAQARRNMIKYLKNQGNYKIRDFKGMSYNDIRPIFEKVWDFNQNIEPMDAEHGSEKQKSPTKEKSPEKVVEEEIDTQEELKEGVKEPGAKRKKSIPRKTTRKRQKLEEDAEKDELKGFLDIVPREEAPIEIESISTKFPIVDWKTCVLTETFMYYQVFRGDGSSKNYKILSEMLEDFDRLDVEELFRLVKERYSTSRPEGFDLMLWGDLHTLFEPDEDDEIWRDQHEYNLLSWRLCDFCGIHILLMENGLAIHMLTEKKYPLSQEMLTKMLSKKLEVDHESSQAFELLRFIRSQVQK
ncbi:DNA helicase [Tanacetum coccineum]|uniref:ATP-dependent DNA helicase n=1 Tax=Tanacetum coccineum TaxID=301880 RepID=A0ABQ4Y103_9ASTR